MDRPAPISASRGTDDPPALLAILPVEVLLQIDGDLAAGLARGGRGSGEVRRARAMVAAALASRRSGPASAVSGRVARTGR